jgi:HEAT repeats
VSLAQGAEHPPRYGAGVDLAEAAARADELAQAGSERELADLRKEWGDELEGAARSGDYRQRAVAYRALGQFRWRAKEELLRRGLDDESPACRGSALISLELLSREHPSTVNAVRPLLHTLVAADGNEAVRRLAVLCLKNGSPQRDTIVLLEGLAGDDEQDQPLRQAAAKVAQGLKRRAR